MRDLYDALRNLVHLFEDRSIPYALMGGLAVRAYAIPRNTGDLDFTVAVDSEQMAFFVEDIRGLGFTVPESYDSGWLDQVSGMPVLKARLYLEGRGIDADLFIADSPYQHELVSRSVPVTVEDFKVSMVTPEDLVLLKLLADRPRDRIDVEDLLFTLGELDVDYLRTWAAEIDVATRLDEALSRHGYL